MDKRKAGPVENTYLISHDTPFVFNEAFNTLRANLRFAAIDGGVKKIIVTSAIEGEGKTTVAINLAICLGQISKRVLLVDTDLRKPKVHRYLKIKRNKMIGVTSALAGVQPIHENIVSLEEYGIHVLPCGPVVPNPTELLQSKAMSNMVNELAQSYEYVIFDSPPVSIVSDAAVLSRLAEGVIFVLRQGYTPQDAALAARKSLQNVQAHVLGCVINSFSGEKSNRFNSSYYYRQYSSYGKYK